MFEKRVTLIKDVMEHLEKGNRTDEQLKNMRMNNFRNNHHEGIRSGTLMMTATSMSSGAMWSSDSVSFQPGGVINYE